MTGRQKRAWGYAPGGASSVVSGLCSTSWHCARFEKYCAAAYNLLLDLSAVAESVTGWSMEYVLVFRAYTVPRLFGPSGRGISAPSALDSASIDVVNRD